MPTYTTVWLFQGLLVPNKIAQAHNWVNSSSAMIGWLVAVVVVMEVLAALVVVVLGLVSAVFKSYQLLWSRNCVGAATVVWTCSTVYAIIHAFVESVCSPHPVASYKTYCSHLKQKIIRLLHFLDNCRHSNDWFASSILISRIFPQNDSYFTVHANTNDHRRMLQAKLG